jgi:L-serine dehydratase
MQYANYKELLEICQQAGCSVGEAALKKESLDKEKSEQDLLLQMADVYQVMEEAALSGLNQTIPSPSGLSGGDAVKINTAPLNNSLLSPMLKDALAMGLAVNETSAAQGKIVACPTAGSCGILPGAIIAYVTHHEIEKEKILYALFASGAIGQIIEANACVSGAKGGCQAECGTAAAMAAGALVELSGGTPEQVVQAATLAIKNLLGLACDPVAGLVEVPCVKRNGILSAYSFIAAEMALAGVKSAIPPDEVVEAMYRIGQMLPSALRETAEGGLAVTPTGLKWKKIITES